jgi:cbb3-type cytochrome oxidase subunit 3
MKGLKFIVILILIILGIAWYLFRPERLFINARANEEFPESASEQKVTLAGSPVVLFIGHFHSVAHEGEGGRYNLSTS